MSNNVVRFFAEKENAEAYSEWVKDPVTIHLLGMAADASRPLGMANPTSESALYLHGLAVGANSIVEFLRHADLFATPAGANVDPAVDDDMQVAVTGVHERHAVLCVGIGVHILDAPRR